MKLNRAIIVLFLLGFTVADASANDSVVIGFARANGDFLIDGSRMRSNATVFNGAVVSTEYTTSRIVLNDGTIVDLGPESRSRVFRDHILVEKGVAKSRPGAGFRVHAGPVRLTVQERVLVKLNGSQSVVVTALNGAVQVSNTEGMPVATVGDGKTLAFEPAQDSSPWRIGGCLQKVTLTAAGRAEDHYVLRDETSGAVVEIVGPHLEDYVGKYVRVVGEPLLSQKPVAGALYVIRTDIPRQRQCVCDAVITSMAGVAGINYAKPGDSGVPLAGAPSLVLGCLQKLVETNGSTTTNRFVLRDEASEAVVELTGADLEANAGHFIVAVGAVEAGPTPVAGRSAVVHEINLQRGACCGCPGVIPDAAHAQSCGTVPAGSANRLPTPPKGMPGAVIGGLVAAGAAGIAVPLALSDTESKTSSGSAVR